MLDNISRDNEGFLISSQDWTKSIALALGNEENIELNDDHWVVITLLRDFYQQFNISPSMRALVNFIKKKLGPEKGNSIYLHQLFPNGAAKQANKIAGLPKPIRCI